MPWLLLPCRVASRTVWHTGVAGLDASVLAWILWRLAEQRFARPPGAQQIAQRDQPDKDHDPAGNPRQSTMVASLTPNGRVAWSIWRRHGRYVELAWRQGHIWLVLLERQTRHRNADGRVSVARGRSSNLDVALTAVSAGRD